MVRSAESGSFSRDLYKIFKERAESISARVYRVGDTAEALSVIEAIIRDTGATRVAAAITPLVEKLGLEQLKGISLYSHDLRRRAAEADIGISEMDLAVAETGTLVEDATDTDKRLVSMLPMVHVALVATDKLVESLRDALGLLSAGLSAYCAFVSGPSRTADIERVLTIGVHGPGEVHVIFVDRTGGAAVDS